MRVRQENTQQYSHQWDLVNEMSTAQTYLVIRLLDSNTFLYMLLAPPQELLYFSPLHCPAMRINIRNSSDGSVQGATERIQSSSVFRDQKASQSA